MNRPILFVALCAISAAFGQQTLQAAEPAFPELKPLEKFIGSWKGTEEGGNVTSESEAQWILGGNFLQQKYATSDGTEGMILRTYDPSSKKYLTYHFDSRGTVLTQRGMWDDETETLTVQGDAGKVTVISKACFPAEGTEEWSITVLDKAGNVQQSFEGKNIRKKE